jgi:methionyl-tRNA formyltransferase
MAESIQNKKIRAVYIGTPQFSADIFSYLLKSEKLIAEGFKFVGVVSNPDRPAQRDQKITPTPVKLAALNNGIEVVQFESAKEDAAKDAIRKLEPDMIIMCAFSQILPDDILKIPRLGVINIHYSLLPRWRGAAPVQYALLNGDTKTGVVLMLTDALMDHGPIYAAQEALIDDSDDAETLIDKLTEAAKTLAESTLPAIAGGSLKAVAQDETEGVLYCRKIQKQDGRLLWEKSSKDIINQIRAFKIWPGSYTYLKKEIVEQSSGGLGGGFAQNIQDKEKEQSDGNLESSKYIMLKIIKARVGVSEVNKDLVPGKIFLNKQGQLSVVTGDGSVIIDILQMGGKKESDALSFLNGNAWIIGQQLIA